MTARRQRRQRVCYNRLRRQHRLRTYDPAPLGHDIQGRGVDVDFLQYLWGHPRARQVALDKLPDGSKLSTVHLVVKHLSDGRPFRCEALFESARLTTDGSCVVIERCDTLSEARLMHARLLRSLS